MPAAVPQVDLHVVVAELTALGLDASLAHTGPGVATVLIGDTFTHPDFGDVHTLALGPGVWQDTDGEYFDAVADADDLYLGPDWGTQAGSPLHQLPPWVTAADIATLAHQALSAEAPAPRPLTGPVIITAAPAGWVSAPPDWQPWMDRTPTLRNVVAPLIAGVGEKGFRARDRVALITKLIQAAIADRMFGEKISAHLCVDSAPQVEWFGGQATLEIAGLLLPMEADFDDLDPSPNGHDPARPERILTTTHEAVVRVAAAFASAAAVLYDTSPQHSDATAQPAT